MANYDVTQATDNGLGDTVGTLSWAILQANTDGETLNSGNVSGTDDTITLQTNVQIDGVMLTLLNSNIEIIGNGFTIDGAFFGESMFHRLTDASKLALW